MRTKNLKLDFSWQQWTSQADDLKALDKPLAARLLFDVLAINEFEHALLSLKADDAVWGPVHTSVGQEAVAAGTVAALRVEDKFAATYRAHHHFLSKVLKWALPDWNPLDDDLPDTGREVVRRTMSEIMGLADGYCGGRGGSMHLRHAEAGFLGSNAIVAGGVPLATGAAYAERFRKSGNVVVAFVGDGAMHQGVLHEALNMAGLWDLPLICLVENNLYAVATSVKQASAVEDVSVRAAAYEMDGFIVDGADVVAVYELVKQVADGIRDGGRPAMIEAKTYRRYHHAGDIPGSAFRYRTREEEEQYRKKEVTETFPKAVVRAGLIDKEGVARITEIARNAVSEAVDAVSEGSEPRVVRASLWPEPASTSEGIRSDGHEFSGIEFISKERVGEWEDLQYSDAIAETNGRWLERDPEAIVFGEEVGNLGGGAYGATKGLPDRYPDRVINTPISEGGFVGVGFGAAQLGMRAIVEIMFADFALVAADQLFNQIAKARHMYGNTTDLPVVVRTRIGTGLGYGAQHSMDPVGIYAQFPGFRIIAPFDSYEYIGLLNSAMQSLDPVVVLEHNALYTRSFPVPAGDRDYFLPFDKAAVVRPAGAGTPVTVIAYGNMVQRCLALADELESNGTSMEIIGLRSLDHPAIDYETIAESVGRTGVAVVIEEANRAHGIGAHLADQLTARCFDDLDGPVATVASLDVSPPVSRVLEAAAKLSDETIRETVRQVAERRWR